MALRAGAPGSRRWTTSRSGGDRSPRSRGPQALRNQGKVRPIESNGRSGLASSGVPCDADSGLRCVASGIDLIRDQTVFCMYRAVRVSPCLSALSSLPPVAPAQRGPVASPLDSHLSSSGSVRRGHLSTGHRSEVTPRALALPWRPCRCRVGSISSLYSHSSHVHLHSSAGALPGSCPAARAPGTRPGEAHGTRVDSEPRRRLTYRTKRELLWRGRVGELRPAHWA